MAKKLTLRLDEDLVKTAKQYAASKGKSVSGIVADLFEAIQNETTDRKSRLTPTVKSLKWILKGKSVSEKDYKKYLQDKYL